MAEKKLRLAYVIASQGHRRRFLSEHDFQPWVENVNKLLNASDFRTVLFSAGDHSGIYFSDYRRLKIIIHKKIRLLDDYFSIFLSFKMLVARRPAFVVIHGLQHYLTLISLIVYGLLKRAPLLILVHGMYATNGPVESVRDKIIKLLLELLKKTNSQCFLLSLTHYDKGKLMKKWGIIDSRVFVSLFPLFMSFDEIRTLSNVERVVKRECGNQCTFLYVGRLAEEKEIHKIILAFYKLLKTGYKVRLIIVGGGPLEQQISSLVQRLRLSNEINIQGIVWGDKKWNFFVESDALILASRHEGLPRVIIEAFAAGKSVVVPRISGIPEIVVHDINGVLFEGEEELVECVAEFVEKIDLFREIGMANKKIVMERMILETTGLEDFKRIIGRIGICAY